jgi:mannose-6-phosphate isomerase-like protein (cupin superfamily)
MPSSKIISKPWGFEEILYENSDLVVLKLFIKKGEETSLHKHLDRDEYFIVLRGKGHLLCGGRKVSLRKGKMIRVKREAEHRWVANEDLVMIEVTTPPLNDLVRIKDKYGRVKNDGTNA